MEELQGFGDPIAEGKTKKIIPIDQNRPHDMVLVVSKDDITAGDGERKDTVSGKAELANTTTCNVFNLLNQCGVATAFQTRHNDVAFVANWCAMLPLEVVVRRYAYGSYLKRRPYVPKMHRFERLVIEFYLKTTNCKFGELKVPKDDPLLRLSSDEVQLFLPHLPSDEPFARIPREEFPWISEDILSQLTTATIRTFLILEGAWRPLGITLLDFKGEYGRTADGRLVLADVADNDSWRIMREGEHLDKQLYRNREPMPRVMAAYREVASLTERFKMPKQTLVLWKASKRDNFACSNELWAELHGASVWTEQEVLSAHKCTGKVLLRLAELEALPGMKVYITYVGRSNGLGPTLAGNCTSQVVSVPAGSDVGPNINSSLAMPSQLPHATILDPDNAMLFARRAFAPQNPLLYAIEREALEKRLPPNSIPLSL